LRRAPRSIIMRLLDASTLVLKDFPQNAGPPYAILSHTWGAEEVTHRDITGPRVGAAKKKGFDKPRRCWQQAMRDGLAHVRVDTCCIDKASSAELSEAINSVFRWYREAAVCYAFLEDVQAAGDITETVPDSGQRWRCEAKSQVIYTGLDAARASGIGRARVFRQALDQAGH
jgi:hypothetical protein